jgi:putative transposase
MPQYRRRFAPGGRYFFTVVLAERGSDLLVREAGALRAAVAAERRRRPFGVEAWVVMPDHMHCVWALPEGDADFPARWRAIKTGFTRAVGGPEGRRPGERAVWQRRYWEHHIRDQADFEAHVGYCWWNPVKHGFVRRPEDWPWSSYRRDLRRWGRDALATPASRVTGEP